MQVRRYSFENDKTIELPDNCHIKKYTLTDKDIGFKYCYANDPKQSLTAEEQNDILIFNQNIYFILEDNCLFPAIHNPKKHSFKLLAGDKKNQEILHINYNHYTCIKYLFIRNNHAYEVIRRVRAASSPQFINLDDLDDSRLYNFEDKKILLPRDNFVSVSFSNEETKYTYRYVDARYKDKTNIEPNQYHNIKVLNIYFLEEDGIYIPLTREGKKYKILAGNKVNQFVPEEKIPKTRYIKYLLVDQENAYHLERKTPPQQLKENKKRKKELGGKGQASAKKIKTHKNKNKENKNNNLIPNKANDPEAPYVEPQPEPPYAEPQIEKPLQQLTFFNNNNAVIEIQSSTYENPISSSAQFINLDDLDDSRLYNFEDKKILLPHDNFVSVSFSNEKTKYTYRYVDARYKDKTNIEPNQYHNIKILSLFFLEEDAIYIPLTRMGNKYKILAGNKVNQFVPEEKIPKTRYIKYLLVDKENAYQLERKTHWQKFEENKKRKEELWCKGQASAKKIKMHKEEHKEERKEDENNNFSPNNASDDVDVASTSSPPLQLFSIFSDPSFNQADTPNSPTSLTIPPGMLFDQPINYNETTLDEDPLFSRESPTHY